MLKTTLTLAAVSLGLLLSTSVSAQSLQYLGPNSTGPTANVDKFQGNKGVLFYNEECAAAFSGGQMCESIDVLRSGSPIPPGPSVRQWIRPTLLPPVFNVALGKIVVFDAAGVATTSGNLSCFGWSSLGGVGLVIFGTEGRFGSNGCSTFLPVACCKVVNLDDDD